jgi:hypothetical protein
MEQKGALLGRIVDIGAEVFAISAACTYASTLARESPERKAEIFELAALFCQQARRRAEVKFDELWHNDDDAQYATAQKILEGRYEFFEADIVDPAGSGPMIPGAHADEVGGSAEAPATEKLVAETEAAEKDEVRAGATG